MKKCSICKLEKELIEFNKDKKSKDEHAPECKKCKSVRDRIYRENNKEKLKLKKKEYSQSEKGKKSRERYSEKIKNGEYDKEGEKICIICEETKSSKEFRTHRRYCKKCGVDKKRIANLTSTCISNTKEYKRKIQLKYRKRINEHMKIYKKERKSNDILYKLSLIMGNVVRNALKVRKFRKSDRTENIIGTSQEGLRLYLESKFEPWMNWGNYGKYNGELNYGWDIDHIIPVSSAKNEKELIALNHFTNLQPLCSFTNRYLKRDIIPSL